MTEQIIAYRFGSFWLCPKCGVESDEHTEPVPKGHLIGCYHYACDQCGNLIAKKRTEES